MMVDSRKTVNQATLMCAKQMFGQRIVGVFVAVAMTLTMMLSSTISAFAKETQPASEVFSQSMPVVESTVGVGADVVSGDNTIVLPDRYGEFSSVLARFTVQGSESITLSEAGSPFLSSVGGETISASTIVSVVDGQITFTSNAAARIRVEVLAGFRTGDTNVGGQVVLADQPVILVDTADGLGVPDLPVAEIPVVANGQLSPQNTRIVIGRITTDLERATTISLGGQEIALPAGLVTTTTFLPVDESDELSVSVPVRGQLRIDLIGYISTTREDATSTATSALVGLDEPTQAINVRAGEDSQVAISNELNSKAVLVLVSAARNDKTVALRTGFDPAGRTTGVAVDAVRETAAQLAVIDPDNPLVSAQFDLQVGVVPVAFIQGDVPTTSVETSVSIDTPIAGDAPSIDHGVWRIEGRFTAGVAVEKIELFYNGESVSDAAAISVDSAGGSWVHEIVPRESGPVTLTARITTADGEFAESSWSGSVKVPESDLVVLSPQTKLLSQSESETLSSPAPGLLESSDRPDFKLGDIVVSGASDGLPEGALGQVIAVAYKDGVWNTVLRPVSLGNVILQGDFDLLLSEDQTGQVSIDPFTPPTDGEVIKFDEQDISGPPARVASAAALLIPTQLADVLFASGLVTTAPSAPMKLDFDDKKPIFEYECEGLGVEAEQVGKHEKKHIEVMGEGTISFKPGCQFGAFFRFKYESTYKPSKAVTFVGNLIDEGLGDNTNFGLSLLEGDWTMGVSTLLNTSIGQRSSFEGEVSAKLLGVSNNFKKPFTFNLGPIPVVMTPSASISPIVSVSASATAIGELSLRSQREFGFTIGSDGKMQRTNSVFDPRVEAPVSTDSAVVLGASAGFEVKVGVSLYAIMRGDLVGRSTLDVDAQLREKMSADLADYSQSSPDLKGNVSTSGKLKVKGSAKYDFGFSATDLVGTTGVGWVDTRLKKLDFSRYSNEKDLAEWEHTLWDFGTDTDSPKPPSKDPMAGRKAYEEILDNPQDHQPPRSNEDKYYYALVDITADGYPELLLGHSPRYEESIKFISVHSWSPDLQEASDIESENPWFHNGVASAGGSRTLVFGTPTGNGVMWLTWMSTGTEYTLRQGTVESGVLTFEEIAHWPMLDAELTLEDFADVIELQWHEIDDRTPLDNLP